MLGKNEFAGFHIGLCFRVYAKKNPAACSMQLLVENAIKHNAVDAAEPLTIRIVALPAIASVVKHQGTRLRISARPRPDFDMVVSRSRVDDFLKWLEGGL